MLEHEKQIILAPLIHSGQVLINAGDTLLFISTWWWLTCCPRDYKLLLSLINDEDNDESAYFFKLMLETWFWCEAYIFSMLERLAVLWYYYFQ